MKTKYWLVVSAMLMLLVLTPPSTQADSRVRSRYRSARHIPTGVTFTVNSTSDSTDKNPGDGHCDSNPLWGGDQCTLRAAIMETNALAGKDTIVLPAGIYTLKRNGAGEEESKTGDLDIADSLVLKGEGTGSTTIAGEAGWDDYVIQIRRKDEPQAEYPVVKIIGVTITGGHGELAGGIHNGGTLTLVRSRVVNNLSPFSGGGILNGRVLKVIKSTIDQNTAEAYGGGIHNVLASTTVRDSTISGNHAKNGGGIATIFSYGGCLEGYLRVENSTISGNTASEWGGGVYHCSRSDADLNNVTITNNMADSDGKDTGDGGGSGGGIAHAASGTFRVKNSIIAGNRDGSADEVRPDCSGELYSQDYNLIQYLSGCTISGAATHNKIGKDPKLGPLDKNGGPTVTHALLPGSPAIDTGNPLEPGSGGNACLKKDQRGVARPRDGNNNFSKRCDIGAYEK